MQINMGSIDRAVRIIAGLGLISLFFILEGNLRWIGLVGIVLVVTALVSRCPAYAIFGIRSGGSRDS
jgi:Protein of unknown function (DUF2892)